MQFFARALIALTALLPLACSAADSDAATRRSINAEVSLVM